MIGDSQTIAKFVSNLNCANSKKRALLPQLEKRFIKHQNGRLTEKKNIPETVFTSLLPVKRSETGIFERICAIRCNGNLLFTTLESSRIHLRQREGFISICTTYLL
jgi:hypothetical protein